MSTAKTVPPRVAREYQAALVSLRESRRYQTEFFRAYPADRATFELSGSKAGRIATIRRAVAILRRIRANAARLNVDLSHLGRR